MLSRKDLARLCPYGYQPAVISLMSRGDSYHVVLGMSHQNTEMRPFILEMDLPLPQGPFIHIDGVERCLVCEKTEVGVRSRVEIAYYTVMRALELALADFVHNSGEVPSPSLITNTLKALISKSNLFVDASYYGLERSGQTQMVRIGTPAGNVADPSWREFDVKDWGKLDPNSTSSGHHINRVFRKGHGAASLSKNLLENGIALRMLPHRTFLLRTTFERHLTQVVPEAPLVANPKNHLSGKNLITALMDLGSTTFEDAIAISKSAATAMTAVRQITSTYVGGKLRILVRIGDVINPKEPVAVEIEGESFFHAEKIYQPSRIVRVRAVPTTKFQKPAWRYQFTFEAVSPVRTGDKLSTRHGTKGVAWVLDDEHLPVIKHSDGTFQRVDVCISPISVAKRRAMSLLYEMMAARAALEREEQIEVPAWHTHPELTFEKLIEDGFGSKTQLHLDGVPLEHETFCAPLLWVRLDKLSIEQMSAQKGPYALGHNGLPINIARVNGQRRDPSKALALHHRRLYDTLRFTTQDNPHAIDRFENLARVLEPDFSLNSLI